MSKGGIALLRLSLKKRSNASFDSGGYILDMIDRIPSFDIRYLSAFGGLGFSKIFFRSGRPLLWAETGLTSEHCSQNTEPFPL
jgi:hypothetical protein